MVTSLALPAPDNKYQHLFYNYVVKSIQLSLDKVLRVRVVLDDYERELALHRLSYGFKLKDAWANTRTLLLALAPQMEQAGYRDEWIPYLEQGIHLSQSFGEVEIEAELRFHLGILYQHRAKYDLANQYLEASWQKFQVVNQLHKQARSLNYLASVARRQHQPERAISLLKEALSLLTTEDIEHVHNYLVSSLVAFDKRNWEESATLAQQSLALAQKAGDKRFVAWSLSNLGMALRRQQKYQAALQVFQDAIVVFAQIHDPIHEAISKMNLGNVYLSLGELEQALHLYIPAKRVFRRAQARLRLAQINLNIAMVLRQLGRWEEAVLAYKSSIEQWEKLKNIRWLVNTLEGLGIAHLEQGHLGLAKQTFERALEHLAGLEHTPDYERMCKTITTCLQDIEEKENYQD